MPLRFFDPLERRRLLHNEFATAINFAPLSSPRAPGFNLDYGSVYGVRRGGLSYGWTTDASADAVSRGVTKLRKNDSFINMQGNTWNIGVENGTYSVYIVAGDASVFNDRMAITAEGQLAVSGITKSGRRYLDGTVTVDVTDGKLTIANAPWATGDKIAYVSIASVETTPSYLDITASTPVASEASHAAGAFTITRGGSDDDLLDTPLTVPLAIGGTATNTVDYGRIGKTVTFGVGVSSITLPVRPVADGVTEGNETVTLTLGSVKGFTNAESSATVTIQDGAAASLSTLKWTTAANRPVAASEIWGEEVGGKLYTFGGFTDTTYKPSKSLYVYDAATNKWTQGASLSVGITHVGIATDGNYIYFAGGYPGNGSNRNQTFSTTAVLRYDIATDRYSSLPGLPAARGAGSMTLLGRTLYFMGGDDSSRHDVTTMWALNLDDLAAGWVTKASLPASRNHAAAVTLDGSIYLMGGQTGQDAALTTHPDLYRYDASTNTWRTLASMPGGRSHISDATFVYNDKIIILGGQSAYNTPLTSNLEYDPTTNVWSTLASLPAPRFSGVGGATSSTAFVYTAGYNTGFAATTYIGRFS